MSSVVETRGATSLDCARDERTLETFTPDAFKAYAAIARAKGFLLVAASPLTRSSYHAGDDFARMKAAREAQLARAGA